MGCASSMRWHSRSTASGTPRCMPWSWSRSPALRRALGSWRAAAPLRAPSCAGVGVGSPATLIPAGMPSRSARSRSGLRLWPVPGRPAVGAPACPCLGSQRWSPSSSWRQARRAAGVKPSRSAVESWERWDLFGGSQALGVTLVWDANYGGIEFLGTGRPRCSRSPRLSRRCTGVRRRWTVSSTIGGSRRCTRPAGQPVSARSTRPPAAAGRAFPPGLGRAARRGGRARRWCAWLRRIAPGAMFKRDPAGLYLDDRKLAACGIHVARGVSVHGFALDVATPPRCVAANSAVRPVPRRRRRSHARWKRAECRRSPSSKSRPMRRPPTRRCVV